LQWLARIYLRERREGEESKERKAEVRQRHTDRNDFTALD
jgi:hypothetical protein